MTNNNITLTETEKEDLNAFFQFQLDKEANYLAAFTSKDPNDKTVIDFFTAANDRRSNL